MAHSNHDIICLCHAAEGAPMDFSRIFDMEMKKVSVGIMIYLRLMIYALGIVSLWKLDASLPVKGILLFFGAVFVAYTVQQGAGMYAVVFFLLYALHWQRLTFIAVETQRGDPHSTEWAQDIYTKDLKSENDRYKSYRRATISPSALSITLILLQIALVGGGVFIMLRLWPLVDHLVNSSR